LDALKKQLNECEKEIKKILKEDPQARLLQTIPGVGKISAFLLLAEIGPLERFPSPEKLCSYAGIVPSYHQSGQVEYRGPITKQGNKFIRWILVEAAHIAVRKDPALKEFYQRIRYKKGAHKATVAVARKLLTYVYHILKRQEPYRYQPRYPKKPGLTFVS
jgi:transposase